MRTVDQVVKDLEKAQEAEEQAHQITEKYRSELRVIYDSAKNALGIIDIFPR